ncbi:hypothetical protein [Streptomyces geranii]|uniref:hypothetical protein n=1 Tax=Streptomyces geranii TaxID=2058923 RepID=UPI0013009A90|nr:hypothetical protein [Streptomyces geranii]
MNVQKLRGYWQDLPAESPNRHTYKPPNEADPKFWAVLLTIALGIFVTVTDNVLVGLGIVAAGLVWGAAGAGQVSAYQRALSTYNASLICLAGYHTFAA